MLLKRKINCTGSLGLVLALVSLVLNPYIITIPFVTLLQKQELAPNVLAMVEAFNSLAHLVANEILAEESLGQRAEVIATYIKVSKGKSDFPAIVCSSQEARKCLLDCIIEGVRVRVGQPSIYNSCRFPFKIIMF